MKKIIKFPSIEQFRNIVSHINRNYNFVGLNEQGEAIYDVLKSKPIITFKGTVKLHGTNGSVCYNNMSGIWFQSRENIITPLKDNAGFATFCTKNQNILKDLILKISNENNIDLDTNTISVYFEWVGNGIQKGVGISQIKKSAFCIGIKISPFDESINSYWINSSSFKSKENRIFNIEDYKTYSIDIDFNNPLLSQNEIIKLTLEVEKECPVSKEFGIIGIGEGIVFTNGFENRLIFKSKGEKHAKSKIKVLNQIDEDKLNLIDSIVSKVTPNWRLEQILNETYDTLNGGVIDNSKIGTYIKGVMSDIIKEDLDIIIESGLTIKDISSKISQIAKNYLFNYSN